MRDIHAPRYESTVDACVGPLLHVIFPEEGCFKVAPHYRVRNEVVAKPREEYSLLARRRDQWLTAIRPADGPGDDPSEKSSWVECEETLQDILMQEFDIDFHPEAHSTPRASRDASTSRQDDSSPSYFNIAFNPVPDGERLDLPKYFVDVFSGPIIDPEDPLDYSSPSQSFGADAPSSSQAERRRSPHQHRGNHASHALRYAGPSTPSAAQSGVRDLTLPSMVTQESMLSPPDFNQTMDSANPSTPQVSGFPSDKESLNSVSVDSFARDVPARGHGHAPHGIPDFMVLRQDTYDGLLIVEDKLHDNPLHQLSRYFALFLDPMDIWFMGCRVAKEPEGGLEFLLAERDRTGPGSTIHNLRPYTANGDAERWYPWNSPHIHNKLREITRLKWKAAKFYEDSPIR
ncbi:hypothetical protein C8Q74DRAFT_1451380 [Fomes fomentarius]|nr:hypothetical protein C8Q74DRAFT_1451380 [Fomes fomentarius]